MTRRRAGPTAARPMRSREPVEAELIAQRPRRAAAIAACLALWLALYGLAVAATVEGGLAREVAEAGGDILGLTAFGLAVITPWTAAQCARQARRRERGNR